MRTNTLSLVYELLIQSTKSLTPAHIPTLPHDLTFSIVIILNDRVFDLQLPQHWSSGQAPAAFYIPVEEKNDSGKRIECFRGGQNVKLSNPLCTLF